MLAGLVAIHHLEQLEHRLVVLVLVRDQQLVDEAPVQQRVGGVVEVEVLEHVERPRADLVHVGAELRPAQDRQLVADPAGVLDRVVETPETTVEGLAPADPLDEPELLEVRDVAEVPGERAEDRRVDPIELVVGERLDKEERPSAGLGETVRDPLLIRGVSPSRREGDPNRLPGGDRRAFNDRLSRRCGSRDRERSSSAVPPGSERRPPVASTPPARTS
jgi:hypothetical protein